MAIMPNPKKHPTSGKYYLRQAIPLKLRPFLEGAVELKRSLHTTDPQEAKVRAVEVLLDFQATLATARNKLAQQESNAAPLIQSQVEQIAMAWRLRETSRLRDPEILERYVLRELDEDGVNYEYSALVGFYDNECSVVDEKFGVRRVNPQRLHAQMKYFAEECLALAQIELLPDNPLYTVLCDRLAKHCTTICKIAFDATREQIKHGIHQLLIPPTHSVGIAVASATSVPDAPKIGEFFEKLADEQGKINPKGSITWRRERAAVVRRFIEVFGDLPLNHITDSMCRKFRELLKQTPYRPSKEINQLPFKEQIEKAREEGLKTIALSRVEVLLHLFSGILTRAQDDALISKNPCSGIKVKVPNVTRERAPEFTDTEMKTLSSSGLFTGDIRPARANYGEAIYWVPVLLIYTGARLEEICQLFRRDVEQKEGQWVIHIRDWDESQSVKTGKSREVPLHPHLLELGFERFLASCAAEGPLFSELKVSKPTGRYSDKLGKWLGEQIRQILGLKTGSISPLHAFRHTFVTHMRDLDIREDIQNAITGHSQGTSVGRRYGSFRQLHNAIAKMPRWPVPVWRPLGVVDAPAAAAEVKA
ncbi:DUF6538 domain-containing protein [Aeromonas rivipollensis]|uniref:DUF6538 domain-containing protein n=1 Tax=Aeromonas rivipollensis TaxID=948519 RepID=UPI00399CAB3D